jgi:hypothetical protein
MKKIKDKNKKPNFSQKYFHHLQASPKIHNNKKNPNNNRPFSFFMSLHPFHFHFSSRASNVCASLTPITSHLISTHVRAHTQRRQQPLFLFSTAMNQQRHTLAHTHERERYLLIGLKWKQQQEERTMTKDFFLAWHEGVGWGVMGDIEGEGRLSLNNSVCVLQP